MPNNVNKCGGVEQYKSSIMCKLMNYLNHHALNIDKIYTINIFNKYT